MSRRPRPFLALVALLALVVAALADVYSVAHHLPYALGGHGRPDRVAEDWPAHGTALGPPLLAMVLIVLGLAALALPSRWGRIGDVLLGLVGLLLLWGTLGEPSFRTVFTPSGFDAVQVLFRLLTLASAGALLIGAVADWRDRRTSVVALPA